MVEFVSNRFYVVKCRTAYGPFLGSRVREDIEKIMPSSHALIHKSTLARLRNEAKAYRRLKKAACGHKQYNDTSLGKRMLCSAMVQNPAMSFYSFEQIIPIVIASLFVDADVEIDDEGVGKPWPSASTLKNILSEGAIDVVACIRKLIEKNKSPLFVLANKGHRKGVNHFVKLIAFWDPEREIYCLDIDGSEGSSEAAAQAISTRFLQSLEKISN